MKSEILGFILTFLFTVFVFLVPMASQYLIDEVIPSDSYNQLFYGLLAFTVICFMQPVIGYFKDTLFVKITESITRDVRNELFNKIVYANFKFLNGVKGGDLISIIMNDGRGTSDFISTIFATLLKDVLLIIMIFIGMFIVSYKITLIVIALFVIYYLFNIGYGKRIQKVSKSIQENYDELCSCVNQTNNAILSIKTYNQEKAAVARFQNVTGKMKRDNSKIDNMSILINNMSSVAITLCLAIIYGWGALDVMNNILTIGQVIALGLYFQLLNQPFFELMNVSINTNVIIPIFDRIEKYKTIEQENVGENAGKLEFDHIYINNLSFSYDNTKDETVDEISETSQLDSVSFALKNVFLTLPSRGLVNIIGESGSGKSTFTKLLLGVFSTDKEKIVIGNQDIRDISLSTLRANISYVPQDSDILNDTISNNVRFGNEFITVDDIIEVCKKLRLDEKIMSLPQGYDSIVTEKVNLSGGEKQRLLIARGILKKAPIMILDEPLSALDAENIEIVNDIIMQAAEARLVLLITHHECDTLKPVMRVVFNKGEAHVVK